MNAQAIFKHGLILVSLFAITRTSAVITTLSHNDPTPPYTAYNPFDFLGTPHNEFLKGRVSLDSSKHMAIEILPFYQRANHGNNSCGCNTELGDISGRWNMIALLPFNEETTQPIDESHPYPIPYTNKNIDLPCGKQFPHILINTRDELLSDIQDLVNPDFPSCLPIELRTVEGLLDLQHSNTTNDGNLGYYAVGIKYKKMGVRFNAEFYVGKGVGFTMQTGIASIDQCASFTDRTPLCKNGNPFTAVERAESGALCAVKTTTWNEGIIRKISTDLMSKLDAITSSTEMNYSICNFHDTSMEDLYGELFWRYPAQINKEAGEEYPKFLFIPFFAVGGAYAIAKCQDFNKLFSLPFGSNGHSSGRFRGGFSLDFYDTIEIDFEGGVTIFKSRCYCNMPMPNNTAQHPFYPFRADALVCPGKNWHLALGMNAHNFWYNWSASFHYVYVDHDQDVISLKNANNAAGTEGHETICRGDIHPLRPDVLECISKWSVQMLNCGLNYAISPDFSIGGFMQLPIKSKNAYRPSTFMLSLFIAV